ncbi:hypothetical protein ACVGXE_06360, partial [Escherichia coli]
FVCGWGGVFFFYKTMLFFSFFNKKTGGGFFFFGGGKIFIECPRRYTQNKAGYRSVSRGLLKKPLRRFFGFGGAER